MDKSNLISGAVMTIFGLITLFIIIPTQTSTAGDATISPALLPQICALGIAVLGAVLVALSYGKLRRGEGSTEAPVKLDEWVSAAVVVIVIAVAVVIFKLVHPGVAVVFLVLTLMLYMGERRWWLLAGIPGCLAIGGYIFFYRILGMAVA